VVVSGGCGYGVSVAARALEVRIRSSAGHVELARLTTTLNQVRLALGEIDHVFVLRGYRPKWVVDSLQRLPEFFVVGLTALETGRRGRRDRVSLLAPVEALVSGVQSLERVPEVPQYYSETTVERLVKIGEPGQGVQEVSLAAVNGGLTEPVPVSEPVRQHAQEAVRGAVTSVGSVAGWLDQMSARRVGKGLLTVGLFDPLTRRAVTGHLPAEMEPQIHGLWRRRVLATGLVTRNERGQAVRIKIDGFELLPEDDRGRASVDELFGMAPDWIDGQNVDEYVREARRG
jgi:hypothetical protein